MVDGDGGGHDGKGQGEDGHGDDVGGRALTEALAAGQGKVGHEEDDVGDHVHVEAVGADPGAAGEAGVSVDNDAVAVEVLDGRGEAEDGHDDGGDGQLAEEDGVDLADELGPDDAVGEGGAEALRQDHVHGGRLHVLGLAHHRVAVVVFTHDWIRFYQSPRLVNLF